jgi:lipopolysaccharide transport system ATP-binding protein
MGDLAIRLERLGKQFRIGSLQSSYPTLRDAIAGAVFSPFRRAARLVAGRRSQDGQPRTFWALTDVSLEVPRGQALGLIGPNGAGKSTLLKILSRITEPTTGVAEIHGRVSSLLEVGTGFHAELTGRENVYLSGAILGMKRAEISRKFDEIVSFAEVDEFIDTPVKHYSSGMHLRLAFAVAAHLEPEILIVDEVLAVGDARFQRKCLDKMNDVGQQGRTVLFVSHSMPAITRLCERVVLLDGGQVRADGPANEVVAAYLTAGLGAPAVCEWPHAADAPGGQIARLRAIRVRGDDGTIADSVDIRRDVRLEMEYEVLVPGYVLMPHFALNTDADVRICSLHDVDPAWRSRARPVGRYVSTVTIPGNLLADGSVFVSAGLVTLAPSQRRQFWLPRTVAFRVVDAMHPDSARGDYTGDMRGVVRPLLDWTTACLPAERVDHAIVGK